MISAMAKKKYIIRKLGDALEYMDGWEIYNTISFSAGLEYLLEMKPSEYIVVDKPVQEQYLKSIASYEPNKIWNTTEINYTDRIKYDAYVYYCLVGLKYEQEFDPDMHIRHFLEDGNIGKEDYRRLRQELSKFYYMVYARIASFSEFIPVKIEEMIAEAHRGYKLEDKWYFSDKRNLENILFMYGFLHELIIMINEENLIKGFIVSESGERKRKVASDKKSISKVEMFDPNRKKGSF